MSDRVNTDELRTGADEYGSTVTAPWLRMAADEIDRLRAAIRAHRRAIRDGVAEDDWEPDPADLALWRAAGLEADR